MSRRIKAFSEPIIPMKEISKNEQKAKEIAEIYEVYLADEKDVEVACMEMAQWKDEQEVEFLQSLLFQSATQNIFEMINNRIKLLKGEQQ